jgi:hypothetical protein
VAHFQPVFARSGSKIVDIDPHADDVWKVKRNSAKEIMERETGIEPATFSLGMWSSIENKEHGVHPISFWR